MMEGLAKEESLEGQEPMEYQSKGRKDENDYGVSSHPPQNGVSLLDPND